MGKIRHHAVSEPTVLLRLLDTIARLAELKLDDDFHRALVYQTEVLGSACTAEFAFSADGEKLLQRHREVQSLLKSRIAGPAKIRT